MKLFYFITKSENGGAQTVLYELLRIHAQRGDTVMVMAHGQGWLAEKTRTLGFEYRENRSMQKTYNPFILLQALLVYRKVVTAFAPDIISCHSSFSGFIGRISIFNKYPVVYTAHGWGFTNGTSFMRKCIAIAGEWIAAFFCKKIICVSDFDKTIAIRYHVAPHHKIAVIHNGADVSLVKKIARNDQSVVIGFLARFTRPKRQDVLLEAYLKLPQSIRNRTRLTFIGGGNDQQVFHDRVVCSGMADHISISGELNREYALNLFASSDIAVLISDWEGFPMTIIEALQLGIPVIANRVGGIAEAVDDTVGRLLPAQPDSNALTQAIAELVEDIPLRAKLAIEAQVRGMLFTTERMARETFTLYASLLSQ